MDSLKCKATGKLMVRNPSNPKAFLRTKSLLATSASTPSITDYEAYITNITFDWGTANTIGIMNNNTYAPTPTELYTNEVGEATRTVMGRTVAEFDAIMSNPSLNNYSNYCKLKMGMMNTQGILSGPLYDTMIQQCRNEAITLGWITG